MEEEAARYNHQIVRVGPVWAAAHAGDVKRLTEALLKSGSTEETACVSHKSQATFSQATFNDYFTFNMQHFNTV